MLYRGTRVTHSGQNYILLNSSVLFAVRAHVSYWIYSITLITHNRSTPHMVKINVTTERYSQKHSYFTDGFVNP